MVMRGSWRTRQDVALVNASLWPDRYRCITPCVNMHMIVCALALVLLLDVSLSVLPPDYQLQRDGVAQAFADASVQQIIHREGGIAITVIEWATQQRTVIPWRHVTSVSDVQSFSREVASLQRSLSGYTGVGDAIQAGMDSLAHVPCEPDRIVFDVSGDGVNNQGPVAEIARDAAQELGIQINGLPILNNPEVDVESYYRNSVITSNGFLVVAEGFGDFSRAIKRKLVMEIGSR